MNWFSKIYDTFFAKGYYQLLLKGLGNTLLITVCALVIGVVIGFLVAVGKILTENNKKLKPIHAILQTYITVIRGVPVVVQLLIFYFVLFPAFHGIIVAMLAFGINSGAYMAELVRSGINAVDQGQFEAGYSLGLSKSQTMWNIIFPQAIRNILPGIGNEFIALLKETSVAGYVAVIDLTRAGNMIRNNTYDAVNPLMVVALTYLLLVILLTYGLAKLEKRLSNGRKK